MMFWSIFLLFSIGCATTPSVVENPVSEQQAPVVQVSSIQNISFKEEENFTRIHIVGSETIAPPLYKLSQDPLRIVIDIPNIDLRQIKGGLKIENGTISEVLATQYDDKGRVEIGLLQMAHYNISREDKNLFIDVEKIKKAEEAKEVSREESSVKETTLSIQEPKKEEPPSVPPPANPPSSVEVKNKAKEVIDFTIEEKKDFMAINIIADGRLENYNSFKLDSPARLVLDLWGVSTTYPKKSIHVTNPYIKKVRIGPYPDKLRLVFDSTRPQLPAYQINRMDDRLIVSIGNVPQPSEPQILLPGKGKVVPASLTSPPVKGKAPASEMTAKVPQKNSLTEIDFKQIDNKSRIVIGLTGEPQFETNKISKNTIAIDIKNASAPKHLRRALDTREFESAVNYIDIQNIRTGKTVDLRILIKLKEEMPFETTLEGKTLFVDIEKPKKVEVKAETVIPPKKEEIKEEVRKEEVKKEEVVKEEAKKEEPKPLIEAKEEKAILPATVPKKPEEVLTTAKVYTGRKVSLDFKDADIKNILRLIAEVSNFNIITADDVSGKITMRLVDVPWDQALEVILQSRSLGMVQVGNVIRIAPQDTLNRESQARLEAKRARERLEDLVTELIPVNYATAKDIIPQIKGILSDRGDVKVDERTNILIIKDIPRNIPPIKDLVKALDTKTPQILIEARIIEATVGFQKELGVSWGFEAMQEANTRGTGAVRQQTIVGGGLSTPSTSPGATTGTTLGSATSKIVDLPAIAQGGVSGTTGTAGVIEFLMTSIYGLKQLDVSISAHENKGNVKIVSSPKIATLDNKEASIEQGLRIPYRKLTTEGTISTDFIDANLKLTVTPHVTNDGNIKMIIKAKKDAPDSSITVDGVPSIDKKEAITEVLVKDNGVVVIAGVYSIQKTEGAEGIPLFSKIPLLGWLFKREAKEDRRRDLLIFISPKIIKDQV